MKSGARNKTEGVLHEMKGKFKEMVGKLTNNPKMKGEGTAENIAGKAQGKVGAAEKDVGE